jgi:AcrR family transcriptional regulator
MMDGTLPDSADAPKTEYKRDKHSRRRGQVLDAAARLFARRGYFTTTMQDIADSLGMRPGSLYHYFKSKEEALAEVCRISGNAFIDNMRAIGNSGGTVQDRIRAGIACHLDDAWRDYVSDFALHRRSLPDSAAAEMEKIARDYMALWVRLIREGQAAGDLNAGIDARTTAAALLSMCNGASSMLPDSTPRKKIAARLFDLFIDGAAAQ